MPRDAGELSRQQGNEVILCNPVGWMLLLEMVCDVDGQLQW